MREILFRGKTAKGEWVEGFYVRNVYSVGFAKEPTIYENHYIYSKNFISEKWFNTAKVEVIPETVGQFTGLYDRNGKKIFEGDILHIKAGHGDCVVGKAIVYFDEKLLQFRVRELKPYAYDSEVGDMYRECDFAHIDLYKVIGNIHDNPELLEVQE